MDEYTRDVSLLAQLDLWEVEVSQMPWRGVSPRELTRSRKALFLRREPQKHERFFVDPDQGDLFVGGRKEPRHYAGASLLLPFP